MIDKDVSDQILEQVDAIENAKVLLGLMEWPQAKQFFKLSYSARNRWGPQLEDDERNKIEQEKEEDWKEIYEEACAGLATSGPFLEDDVEIKDLPNEQNVQDYISDFTNSDYFLEVFGSINSSYWDIKMIPIESLVAWQPYVTTQAHKEIPTTDQGIIDTLQYCLPADVKNYIQTNIESHSKSSASVRVVSRSPNIDFRKPKIQSISDRPAGNVSIDINIVARPNFVTVVKFGNRYILKNGYHRCFQLLKAGEKYVPAVLRYGQNFQQTGAADSGWFGQGMILGQRPPLVSDFLTDVAVDMDIKSTNTMIQLLIQKLSVSI